MERQDKAAVDVELVKKDAKALYSAGEGRLGTNEAVFIDIFGKRSHDHLKLVALGYADHAGHSLQKAVEKETSGDFRKALLTISYQ